MVSMKEIARECGVSVATVSKALSDKGDISKATRERIRAVAEEMGYMLNASARALKTNRTYSIGVLFVDRMSAGLSHEYFSQILESFRKAAEESGYDISFINNRVDGRESTYLKHCQYRSYDGVVIISAEFMDPQILELVDSDIPVVSVDYSYDNCSSVISDNTKGMRELVKYAASMGHKKLGFIHGEITDVTKKRIMGFFSACREMHVEAEDKFVLEAKYHDIDCSYDRIKEILAAEDRPTCVIFPDDFSLIGTMSRLAEEKISLTDIISVMGYDGIRMSKFVGLTTYEQDATSLGRIACRRLIDAIENPQGYSEHSVVAGKLIKGHTVKKV